MDSLGEQALAKRLEEYLNFDVGGRRVPIPYFRSKSRWKFSRSCGKGTPIMIREELVSRARATGFNLGTATSQEVYQFMRNNEIGVECSGFVYHLLDAYITAALGSPLQEQLRRFPGGLGLIEQKVLRFQRYRRINAQTLTSNLNSHEITQIDDIKIADLIRMSIDQPADHVLIVVAIDHDPNGRLIKIKYAHSSTKNTKHRGPHTAEIMVTDQNQPLVNQIWGEPTIDGKPYNQYFHPELGDTACRLNAMGNAR